MSVQKDKKTGKWMCQIRVTDWKGEEHHKKKRGFNTKKEALEWEMDFWTRDEFNTFIKYFEEKPKYYAMETAENSV